MEESTTETSGQGLAEMEKKVNSSSLDLEQKTDDVKRESSNGGPEEVESHGDWLHGLPLFMVITGLTLVTMLFMLDMSIISPAIPSITTEFDSLGDIGWYGAAYSIASASLQTMNGKLFKFFSLKWTYLGFFIVFELGSLICALADSSIMFIIGRAIAGIGCSGLLNGGLLVVAGSVPMERRPALLGIILGVAQIGFVLGPLIGGAFTSYSTWRWCFYINLPIGGLVGVLLLFTHIPEQMPKKPFLEALRTLSLIRDFDIIGFFFFVGASIELLLGLEYGGNQYAWNSATVIGLLCGSIATFVVFGVWEHHMGQDAMLPGSLVRRRVIWSSSLMSAMIFGLAMPILFYTPIYFQSVRGTSALDSGVDLLPTIIGQLVAAVISGIMTSKLGYYLPWGVLGGILTSVSSGLLATLSTDTSTARWAAYLVLNGLGRGAAFQVPMVAVQNSVSPADMSAAMAILTCSQTFGGAVALAVAQAIFTQGLRSNIPKYAPGVSAQVIIEAGATGFQHLIPPSELPGVLVAYVTSIDWTNYFVAGLSVLQFVFALGVGWKSVKGKQIDPAGGA
ncbi:major facilitator superfamily transporter [Trichoderma afarasin]